MSRSRVYNPRRGSGTSRQRRDEAVERIYRDDEGQLPDFSRLDRRPPTWRRWAIGGGLVMLAVLAIAAWASFLIFKPYTTTSGGSVAVAIDAPPTAAVGAEVTYRITIENGDRVPLARTSVEMKLPTDFTVTEATPAPDDARGFRWTIGTIPANGERIIDLHGRLYGAPEQDARVEAVAVYRPGNFNADFQTVATAITRLDASPITIALTGPERTVPGEAVTYTIAYEHLGTLTTPEATITLDVPRAFILTTTTPDRARSDALLWRIGALAPNAKGTITVTGSFNAGAQEPLTIRATVAIEPAPERRVSLQSKDIATTVLGGDVVLIATANDQTSGFTTPPGTALRFRIAIRNDGKEELRDLIAYAVFEATSVTERSILNFSAITDGLNGTAIGEQLAAGLRRGTITWTAKEYPELAALPPGQLRTIDFTIPIHTPASLSGFPEQGRITFSTAVDIGKTGEVAQQRRVTTAPVAIQVPR
ncbi:MAG: hypothetical protein Q7R80_02805 [bacterium]|nr:hypothetical protein [bacterium]